MKKLEIPLGFVNVKRIVDHPTGCATSCPSQRKWLEIALHGILVSLLKR